MERLEQIERGTLTIDKNVCDEMYRLLVVDSSKGKGTFRDSNQTRSTDSRSELIRLHELNVILTVLGDNNVELCQLLCKSYEDYAFKNRVDIVVEVEETIVHAVDVSDR
jgi:hypothetical protein